MYLHAAPYSVFGFSVQAETSVGPGLFSNSRMFSTPEFGELFQPENTDIHSIEPMVNFSCIFHLLQRCYVY